MLRPGTYRGVACSAVGGAGEVSPCGSSFASLSSTKGHRELKGCQVPSASLVFFCRGSDHCRSQAPAFPPRAGMEPRQGNKGNKIIQGDRVSEQRLGSNRPLQVRIKIMPKSLKGMNTTKLQKAFKFVVRCSVDYFVSVLQIEGILGKMLWGQRVQRYLKG